VAPALTASKLRNTARRLSFGLSFSIGSVLLF
jgi:hypothetical protein